MAEAWIVSRTANGINVIDENGLPVCTRVGLDDAKLIASAPRLAEQVRILREALGKIAEVPLETDGEDAEWERSGSDSEEILCRAIRVSRAALEDTKEGA